MRTRPRPASVAALASAVIAIIAGGCSSGMSEKRVQMPTMTLESQGATALAPEAGGGQSMQFNVVVKNPYAKPMGLLSTAYAVNAEGKVVASGREDLRVKNVPPSIPPGKTQSVPVSVRVTAKQILESLAGAGNTLGLPRGGETTPMEADVFVMVDSPVAGPVTLSARSTGTLSIPPAMNVEVQGVLFDAAGGPGEGWIGVAVMNRCAFAVQVQSVACDVTFDKRIMATAHLALDQRVESGARVELNLPLTFNPPLAAGAKPAPGARLSYELRGTASGSSERGPVTIMLESTGKASVAE